jgi:murein DD-endopeptidase MepM/ murein hydrolase activator NlpD
VELQYHPATGRRTVSAVSLGARGERAVVFVATIALLLSASLWWTVPAVLRRATRKVESRTAAAVLPAARDEDARVRAQTGAFAQRELAWGDRLARVAFLYGIAPSRWPRALDPARGLLAGSDPGRLASELRDYLAALERGRATLAAAEAEDPGLAARTPSIVPISGACEPAAVFGPRVSPWTGQEEFFSGLDLAAAEGSAVVAPAEGRVVFAGRLRRERTPRLWQFGNLVIIAHGPGAATLYGHLSRIDVRRGDRVRRGQRIGAVGKSGWAISPRLHYELWRPQPNGWRPTDPEFAILDRRLDERHRSLEQMLATSAPGPAETLPGVR